MSSIRKNDLRENIDDAMRNYTDHKLGHSYNVMKRILELTDNAKSNVNFPALSENAIFVFALAALLHDICMSGHPKIKSDKNIMEHFEVKYKSSINYNDYPEDARSYSDKQQEEIRKFHAYFAIAKIKLARAESTHDLHSCLSEIEDDYLKYVFILVQFHCKEPLIKIPDNIPGTPITDIVLPFSAILFRLADELDLGNERDIKAAREQGMIPRSEAYWEMDFRMDVSISSSNYISIKFRANQQST